MADVPAEYRDLLRTALKEERQKEQQKLEAEKRSRRNLRKKRLLGTPNVGAQKSVFKRENGIRTSLHPKKPVREEHERYVVHLGDETVDKPKLKKRKKDTFGNEKVVDKRKPDEVIDLNSDAEDNAENQIKQDQSINDNYEDDDDDVDSDEFEDVDLEGSFIDDNDTTNDDNELNITIRQHRGTQVKKANAKTVSGEERAFRRQLHILYLFIMIGHGVSRNCWISDSTLLRKLQTRIPSKLKIELNVYLKHRIKTDVTTQSKTRKLLDLLRHLMEYWQEIWTLDLKSPILYKKTWNEIEKSRNKPYNLKKNKRRTTKIKFIKSVLSHTGSRDLCAQGFVSLLRCLNLPARLVFSLQPPDFTNMKKCQIEENGDETISEKIVNNRNRSGRTSARNAGSSSISRLRAKLKIKSNNKPYSNKPIKTQSDIDSEFNDKYGAYPVFWCEVWDKDSKKYITIDPIVFKIIEVVNWKSKLEPPMTFTKNNAWYVVGFDRVGGCRDITRRYAKEYNAKVRKKRITREEKWDKWWNELLLGACSNKRINENRVDKFENLDFEELGLREGMPSNISDFKGHPIYVLESDLKFNEILQPKISCGGLSNKSNSKRGKKTDGFIPVYKRSNVHTVRSAKGWYMRGRVLKIGERPLKIREKVVKKPQRKRNTEDEFELSDNEDLEDGNDDDDENDKRLYAEYQTDKYVPPPMVNGIIPKNVYKNIDVYEPWMIPEGCVHIKDKLSDKAAKLMGIEYAPAVVGFEFSGGGNRRRREVSANIVGIVTLKEYEEAVLLICEGLKESEEDDRIKQEDLINLRAWKVLLTKLKISKRLIHEHGEIESDKEEDEESEAVSSGNDNEDEDDEEGEFESGGFFLGNKDVASNRTRSHYMNANEIELGNAMEDEVNENNTGRGIGDHAIVNSDLSASDFESDEDNYGGGFHQNDNSMEKDKENSVIEAEDNDVDVKEGENGDEKIAAKGIFGGDGNEDVYNPEGEEMEFSDDDDDDDDERMNDLDEEFAGFEKEFEEERKDETRMG